MANQFVSFTPYDEQMAELQRRQRLAELMQQQAMQPLETPQSGGRMIAKVSPLAGLAKMLQAYSAGAEARDIEKQRGQAEERARGEAQDWFANLGTKPQPMSPDAALAASLSATPTEAQKMPMSSSERTGQLMQGAMGANPYTSKLATMLLSQKPQQMIKEVDPKEFTPASLMQFQQSGNYADLVPAAEKPAAVPADIQGYNLAKEQGFPGNYTDWRRQLAEATRPPAPQEPLVPIVGVDGKAIYVPRNQAIGKTPFTATTAAQEQRAINQEQSNKSASISTQQALDLAEDLYKDPNRTTATGFSSVLSNIPGTGARDFQAKLNTFKAQTFIPMVSALKGMGALSDAEGKKLSESIGALDPAMSEESFAKSLKDTTKFLYDKAVAAGLNVTLPTFAVQTPPPPPGFKRQEGNK